MPFQETSTAILYFRTEGGTYGTLPGGAYSTLRVTSESLEETLNSTRSEQLSGNRQGKDILELGRSVTGDLGTEMSYDQMVALMPHVMFNTGTADATVAVTGITFDVNATTGTYTATVGTPFTNATKGQLVWFSGFSGGDIGNNGWKRILKVTSSTVAIVEDTDSSLVTTTGIASCTADGISYFTGTQTPDATSFALQKAYTDTTVTNYLQYAGCLFDSMTINASANERVSCTFGVRGKAQTTSTTMDGTVGSTLWTDDIMLGKDLTLYVGGTYAATSASVEIDSASITVNNQLRERWRTGSVDLLGYGAGVQTVEGTVKAYFSSRATLDDYLAFTSKELTMSFENAAGEAVAFDFPNVKITSHKDLSPGNSQDVYAEFAFSCAQDGVSTDDTVSAQQWSLNFAPTTA